MAPKPPGLPSQAQNAQDCDDLRGILSNRAGRSKILIQLGVLPSLGSEAWNTTNISIIQKTRTASLL